MIVNWLLIPLFVCGGVVLFLVLRARRRAWNEALSALASADEAGTIVAQRYASRVIGSRSWGMFVGFIPMFAAGKLSVFLGCGLAGVALGEFAGRRRKPEQPIHVADVGSRWADLRTDPLLEVVLLGTTAAAVGAAFAVSTGWGAAVAAMSLLLWVARVAVALRSVPPVRRWLREQDRMFRRATIGELLGWNAVAFQLTVLASFVASPAIEAGLIVLAIGIAVATPWRLRERFQREMAPLLAASIDARHGTDQRAGRE